MIFNLRGGGACPEQYDILVDGKYAGYMRLRHGTFRVENAAGETVHTAEPNGDGCFADDEERRAHIIAGLNALTLDMGCVGIVYRIENC